MDPYKRKVHILEEFTRFGGGQTVFESIYDAVKSGGYSIEIITDKKHRFLPQYLNLDQVTETMLPEVEWNSPLRVYPTILKLKRELSRLVPEGITINNHPNVFIYNSTVNFVHEMFGFMSHNPRPLDKLVLKFLKTTGLFNTYEDGHFLVQGSFTKKQTTQTFNTLGIRNTKIETIDLPVDIPETISLSEKKPIVLTFGRISPDKRLEAVLEIAAKLKDVSFVIAGRVVEHDTNFMNSLFSRRPKNVSVIVNPDPGMKDRLFRDSKVYLHTKINENYGISVAEAISYGLVPVVPKKGGPFTDILDNGNLGFGYDTMEEAASLVESALLLPPGEVEPIYSTRHRFSKSRFREKFLQSLSNAIQ